MLGDELRLLGEYGLRSKKELGRHRTMLSKFRGTARSLLSMSAAERAKPEAQFLGRLKRLGILSEDAALDNVLDLAMEELLERRLQTLVLRKGLSTTMAQSRQLITHGHISIEGRKMFSPSYLVPREKETEIAYAPTSPLASPEHPLREVIEAEASGGEPVE